MNKKTTFDLNVSKNSPCRDNSDKNCEYFKADLKPDIPSFKICSPKKLNSAQFNDLEQLIRVCGGYEPFYSIYDGKCEKDSEVIIQTAAYSGNTMIGFVSCCFNEMAALVHPNYRRRGVFAYLFESIKKDFKHINHCSQTQADDKDHALYFRAPDFIEAVLKSHTEISFSHSEYLMKLKFEHSRTCGSDLIKAFPDAFLSFSDDEKDYLMYLNSSDDEPCAVCSLDYQSSYTMIYDVFVDEKLRGKKAGTFLITSLIDEYFSGNQNPLLIEVSSLNLPAFRLYKSAGFRIKEQIDYFKICF